MLRNNLICQKLFCDNQAVLAICKNGIRPSVKHVRKDYHFILREIELKTVDLNYVQSNSNLSDIFTKPLGGSSFHKLKLSMDLPTLSKLV